MRFVRIIFYLIIVTFTASCQIIEFPEDEKRTQGNDDNKSSNNIIYENKENYNTHTDEQAPEASDPVRPSEGFLAEKSLEFLREFQFTNFDIRDFSNPFFTVLQFLDAIKTMNFTNLREVTSPNFTLFRSIKLQNTPEFWGYIRGFVGLYKGIKDMRSVNGSLHFTMQSISKSTNTVLVLSTLAETWKISNIVKVINSKSPKISGINKYITGDLIWLGSWDVGIIDSFEFILIKPKLSHIELLRKILADARDRIDLSPSANFLTNEISRKSLPAFMRNSASDHDSKLFENQFMINFYKTYNLDELISIARFPVTENLQIETFAAFFNVKINPVVFINWLVIDGVPYIERIELPTGSSQQVFFNNLD